MNVSIILPVHNEEKTIGRLMDDIHKLDLKNSELIVVNDGSRDGSLQEIKKRECVLIDLPKNLGKGLAMRQGLEKAKGDILVFMDADYQDDPREIPKLIDKIGEGYDMVIGSRYLGKFHKGSITRLNYFGTKLINSIVNILFRAKITDTQAGFRAFRKTALSGAAWRAKEYEVETEMLIFALKSKVKISEIPVQRFKRDHDQTGFRVIRNSLKILGSILKNYFLPKIR